jgi:hypothetical protein
MNPRHAAALALVGWYLMVPPSPNGIFPNEKAPLSEWVIITGADSAYECRELEIALQQRAIREWRARIGTRPAGEDKAIYDKAVQKTIEQMWEITPVGYATCVSTYDPRLKRK